MKNAAESSRVGSSSCTSSSKAESVADLIGESGVKLREHQIDGLKFMIGCHNEGHGCIVADEMGLGKTCQSVGMLDYLHSSLTNPRFAVICPLSVFDHWTKEIQRFGCGCLTCVPYRGDKERRAELRSDMKSGQWNLLLTTYELFLKDVEFFGTLPWSCIVVDEGHRLKNSNSQIFGALKSMNCNWVMLLTGTPVQNNLDELYSLLCLVAPRHFPLKSKDSFLEKYSDPKDKTAMQELRTRLKKYILRRTKDLISAEIPDKTEVLLYHGITGLQKRLYKAILTKNYDVFEEAAGKEKVGKQRLMNTLMQLRKCVNHPYLFEGVEPEPFEEGEHMVEASGKLMILDSLLGFLKRNGHKVLVFSQMTKTLDILQDYLAFRGLTYERLDGSVRGEERFAAVNKFNEDSDTFVFLLSTKAGGVGLTLTGADTVIFMDSDFNPQNDLQAAARAHRIGQDKPVKIIRLVAKHTVEEIVLARAEQKLKLTNAVMEGADKDEHQMTAAEITELLTFGLQKMTTDEESGEKVNKTQQELVNILGDTQDGLWKTHNPHRPSETGVELEEKEKNGAVNVEEDGGAGDMYVFEGKDYKEEARQADKQALTAIVDAAKKEMEGASLSGTSSARRRNKPLTFHAGLPDVSRKVKILTPEEMEERKKKRAEAAARKKERQEQEELQREIDARERQKKYWEKNNYTSMNLPEKDAEEEEDGDSVDIDEEAEAVDLVFVSGDVAHPQPTAEHQTKDALIVHCVDNSGWWPHGGVFGAISNRSVQPEQQYKLARKMGDLALGDVHLLPADELQSRGKSRDFAALIVAQDKRNRDEMKMEALRSGLERLSWYALKNDSTVHLPRIGYGLAKVNWYGIERMIRKILSRRGIPTYIYYFPRGKPHPAPGRKRKDQSTSSPDEAGKGDGNGEKRKKLTSLFGNMTFFLGGMEERKKKEMERLILAFDGDVAESMADEGITHILLGEEGFSDEERERAKALVGVGGCVEAVKRSWMDACLKESKLHAITHHDRYKF